MGISVNDSKLEQLARLISEWPGLVSGPAQDLVADSLVLLEHLGDAKNLVDVGSGAGLPGLPLKIVRPDLRVTLVESDQDKAAFLVRACAALGLQDVTVLAKRAEEVGQDPGYRELFDVAVARPLAQKTAGEDIEKAARAIDVLGGALNRVAAAPSTARGAGTVVIVDKVRPTPPAYPRRPGAPSRKPL